MTANRRWALAFSMGLLLTVLPAYPASFAGKSLTEALQELQRQGLRLVFSSNVVSADMIVETEPGTSDPRQILDELIAPHDLAVHEDSTGVLVIVSAADQSLQTRHSVSGQIRSQLDQKPIRGVTVRLLEEGSEAISDSQGRFEFDGLSPGTYTLMAIQRGFIVDRQQVDISEGDRSAEITFLLTPAPITEEEVVVTPSKMSLLHEQPAGFFALDREELLALPHLDNDFFRALTLLPGVTSNDVSAQFHVRGGRRDETQILLDGQELYDSYHLKDFDSALSVVTPDSISRIDLSTGGFPVEYGDRMSGVLDMATATPNGAPRGRVALGILSAQAGGAGAFRQERGNWVAQFRRGTTDFAGRIFGTDAPRYWDAFGKVEYQIKPRHRLRLNILHTDDKYAIEETVDGDFKSFQTNYRGSYLWLTHQAILGASTFVESAASITRIDRDRNGLEIEEDFRFGVRDLRDMEVLGLRQGWNHQLNRAHSLRWGFELRDFDTEFDYTSSSDVGPRSPAAGGNDDASEREFEDHFRENHFGVYFSDGWQVTEPLKVEVGLRYDNHTLTDEGLLSPRLNLLYALKQRGVLRFAFGQFNQSQRPYELQVEDGETDFYSVERSEQMILGYEHSFSSPSQGPGLAFRAEAYYRNVGNPRPRYENLYEPLNTFPEVEPDRLRIAPDRSRAQGVELFLRGTIGRRTGWWVNYAHALTEDEIDEAWVPRRFDQPNTVNLDIEFSLTRNWRLNLAGRYHTGWPITPVSLEKIESGGGEHRYQLALGPLNSDRLPDYRRLDLRASRDWGFRFGVLTLFVDIQNLLNHRNAAGLDIIFDEEEGTLIVNQEYWVGFFPSVGVAFEFGGGSSP